MPNNPIQDRYNPNPIGSEFENHLFDDINIGEIFRLYDNNNEETQLYRKETEDLDKKKYNSLPVFSSCKVKNEGEFYKRNQNQLSTQEMIQKLENQEMLKNMGIDSESSNELLTTMQNGNMADNMNVNVNLV